MVRTADMKPSGASLEETVERARAAWAERWRAQAQPVERFRISFRAGWPGCGEAMAAICGFDIADVSWEHDPPVHVCSFSCTFDTLKSVQAAVKGTPVADLHCNRR